MRGLRRGLRSGPLVVTATVLLSACSGDGSGEAGAQGGEPDAAAAAAEKICQRVAERSDDPDFDRYEFDRLLDIFANGPPGEVTPSAERLREAVEPRCGGAVAALPEYSEKTLEELGFGPRDPAGAADTGSGASTALSPGPGYRTRRADNGTYVVGVDIAPGRWGAPADIDCRWSISGGSSGTVNGRPGDPLQIITLRSGQTVTFAGCTGYWFKQD